MVKNLLTPERLQYLRGFLEKEGILTLDQGGELLAAYDALATRAKKLELAYTKTTEEISQTLGRALGYPRYCDDQKNFPGATDEDGVCVGDHVAETLANEAARRIASAAAVQKLSDDEAGQFYL